MYDATQVHALFSWFTFLSSLLAFFLSEVDVSLISRLTVYAMTEIYVRIDYGIGYILYFLQTA